MEWGSVADWFGAVGTISAVIVALWQSLKKPTVKARVEIKERSENTDKIEYRIRLINLSTLKLDSNLKSIDASPLEVYDSHENSVIKAEPLDKSASYITLITSKSGNAGTVTLSLIDIYTETRFQIVCLVGESGEIFRTYFDIVPKHRITRFINKECLKLKNKLL